MIHRKRCRNTGRREKLRPEIYWMDAMRRINFSG